MAPFSIEWNERELSPALRPKKEYKEYILMLWRLTEYVDKGENTFGNCIIILVYSVLNIKYSKPDILVHLTVAENT